MKSVHFTYPYFLCIHAHCGSVRCIFFARCAKKKKKSEVHLREARRRETLSLLYNNRSFLSVLHTHVSPLAVPHGTTAIVTLTSNSAITAD